MKQKVLNTQPTFHILISLTDFGEGFLLEDFAGGFIHTAFAVGSQMFLVSDGTARFAGDRIFAFHNEEDAGVWTGVGSSGSTTIRRALCCTAAPSMRSLAKLK